jgi:hypothetical protein
MYKDWSKISLVARELGVTVKTIYNWVESGKLFMPQPGYVNKQEAFNVWANQQSLRSINSYFMAIQGIKRDSNGRFQSRSGQVE